MKKLIVMFALCAISALGYSQAYVSPSFSYYDGVGQFKDKAMLTLEVGKTINETLSVGVAGGVLNFRDYTPYVELRPTVTVLSLNNVSLSGTLGVGYVFNQHENLLVELGTNLGYSFSDKFTWNLGAGLYKFNGENSASKATYVSTGFTYSLK